VDPKILGIKKINGIAGQYQINAKVQYEGEEPETVGFVGSVYGGPIVMVMPSGMQTFVSGAVTDRLGSKLDESWVRRFFGPREA
jgi:hypothetical protein